jgi:hypothetical protein
MEPIILGKIVESIPIYYDLDSIYTKLQLQTSGQSSVHWDNITNTPTTLMEKFPTTGVYRNYTDVLPLSSCKEVKALSPINDIMDPLEKVYSSGQLQIGEYYRVTGTGSILHASAVFIVNEEFQALETTFAVNALSPVVKIGSQHSLFGDCSQLYNSQVVEVGNYYYMYYCGNTQKYKTSRYAEDFTGALTNVSNRIFSATITAAADYSGTVAGATLFTAVGHGLITGNVGIISGTTSYNGSKTCYKVDNDHFYRIHNFISDQSGTISWPLAIEITGTADYSGTVPGATLFTAPSHRLSTGTNAAITGTINYEGNRTCYRVDADHFYQVIAFVSDQIGVITPGIDWIQKNADYGRNDRVFMAYKLKSEGLLGGKWQKWEDARKPVLDVSGEYSGAMDATNAWFRNIFHDGTQYVMFYTGDSSPDGGANISHTPHPMIATSPDGIIWTKLGAIITAGLSALNFGSMIYANNKYYLFIPASGQAAAMLYSNVNLAVDGWVQISSNLLPGYGWIFSAQIFDDVMYIFGKPNGNNNDMRLFSCPVADIETPANWVNLGIAYSIPKGTSLTVTGENRTSTDVFVVYPTIAREGTDKWVIYYSYYKSSFARPPFVNETNVRCLSFSSSIPFPA